MGALGMGSCFIFEVVSRKPTKVKNMINMNLIYLTILTVIIFIFLSIVFYRLCKKHFRFFIALTLCYIVLTYLILFPLGDYLKMALNFFNIRVFFSHTDAVLLTEIWFFSFGICILNIFFTFFTLRIKKRKYTN